MRLHIHHHHYHKYDTQLEVRLRVVEHRLDLILNNQETIMEALTKIKAATERTEGVSLSIRTHLEALGKFIRENVGNSTELNALADRLENSAASEEAAILANPLPGTTVPPQPE